ncbi:hypothetical protein MSAN_00224200 [Mycena sanguinolenta]|uniref:Uncharacterized protein n=1 Tax=Mycena sanguinolenta TaxID=230812 RepID=A0A8H6ZFE6_9AGAR|nr:hypothetical protein MSAN_00224200 [Mycena sanguinolenta]
MKIASGLAEDLQTAQKKYLENKDHYIGLTISFKDRVPEWEKMGRKSYKDGKEAGTPRLIQIPWILWQDPTHGESLHARYQQQYHLDPDAEEQDKGQPDGFEQDSEEEEDELTHTELLQWKLHLAQAYFNELGDEEQARIQEEWEAIFIR